MKILIDNIPAWLLGSRNVYGKVRYYYGHDDYPHLLVVAQGQPLEDMIGQVGYALFNFDSVDSRIVVDILPDVPVAWKDKKLVQITVRVGGRLPPGRPVALSEALRERL